MEVCISSLPGVGSGGGSASGHITKYTTNNPYTAALDNSTTKDESELGRGGAASGAITRAQGTRGAVTTAISNLPTAEGTRSQGLERGMIVNVASSSATPGNYGRISITDHTRTDMKFNHHLYQLQGSPDGKDQLSAAPETVLRDAID